MGIFGKTYDPYQWEKDPEQGLKEAAVGGLDPGTAALYGIGKQYGQATEGNEIVAPQLSEQEMRIIAQMKKLAMGNPELGKMYEQYTLGAMDKAPSEGLQRDLKKQEEITKEQIARGLGSTGDIRSAPGRERMGLLRENALMAKDAERLDRLRKGEGLMTSRTARMVGAGQTALNPMEFQGQLQSLASQQSAANTAQRQAGLMNLAGTAGGLYDAAGRKKKPTQDYQGISGSY